MSHTSRADDELKIFLSFAGSDRGKARVLAEALQDALHHRRCTTFVDDDSMPFGTNVVSAIEHALKQSHYFVLLWSEHTASRQYVEIEWTAALVREVNQRRSFLFVVRLDDADLPHTLAPRRFLNGADDLRAVAEQLAADWDRDRSMNNVVLPTPVAAPAGELTLYVRNRAYSTAHVLHAAAGSTGTQLAQRIALALDLPDGQVRFNGLVGVRFTYSFQHKGTPLADGRLDGQGVHDDSVIDLVITTEVISGEQPVATFQLRDARPSAQGFSDRVVRSLVNDALAHLRPW